MKTVYSELITATDLDTIAKIREIYRDLVTIKVVEHPSYMFVYELITLSRSGAFTVAVDPVTGLCAELPT